MGLFSTKKTYVSSVAHNMAGDEEKRSNYMKSLVVGNIITNSNFSISNTLQSGYMNGPGMKMRSFFRWALNNYDDIGVPVGNFNSSENLDLDVIEEHVPRAAGTDLLIQDVQSGQGEFSFWADQYMLDNHADLLGSDWVSDVSDTGVITITFEDATTHSFTPSDYSPTARYIYVTYNETETGITEPEVDGVPVALAPGDPWPSLSGWSMISSSEVPSSHALATTTVTTITYSDATPDEGPFTETTPSTGNYTEYAAAYSRTVYLGQDPGSDRVLSQYQRMELASTGLVETTVSTVSTPEDIGGGVIRTTTVETTTESLVIERGYRIDTSDIVHRQLGDTRLWIYRIGSGNAELDALASAPGTTQGEFFPFIPIRLNNRFLSEAFMPETYDLATKAYKKAVNGKFDDLIEVVADNEDLDEIDYAYVMYGVSLNVKENACRKYLYKFFEKLMGEQTNTVAQVATWEMEEEARAAGFASWLAWKAAQGNPTDPLFGQGEPVLTKMNTLANNTVHIRGTGSVDTNVDMKISWKGIQELLGSGLKKPGAKKGELWLEVVTERIPGDWGIYTKELSWGNAKTRQDNTVFDIHWQVDEDNWRTLRVIGLQHENLIYKNKSVVISAKEALEDEDETGFIIPLHYETVRELSLVDSTQMSTACTFIVFNCYKVVKKKFYQTGIFKVVMFVAIVAISVATMGAAAPGLLGTAASVGAAVGLTGLAAIIVGAVINAIVAMIVMQIIGLLATEVLGAKIGLIVAMVVSVATMQVGTGLMNGASMTTIWSNMLSAQNLIAMTSAVGDGISGLIAMSAAETMVKTQDLIKDFEEESRKISELYAENVGYANVSIDPLSLTDVDFGNSFDGAFRATTEPLDTFLSRTLMTGSDIAELSHDMLNNFTKYTLSTDLNLAN